MASSQVPAGGVVVGVDGSSGGHRALLWAADTASLEGRPLVLAHAVGRPDAAASEVYGIDHAVVRRALETAGAEVLRHARHEVAATWPSLVVEEEMRAIDPRALLLDLADSAALVVVGTRGRGTLTNLLLGSVSLAVSQHATCPVAVVRPHDTGLPRDGVLVGVDLGPGSTALADVACRQASLRKLPLTVLHVFFDGLPPGPVPDDEPGHEPMRLAMAGLVAGLAGQYPDVDIRPALVRGLVEDALVEAAAGKDLAVVGAHPTRPLLDFFRRDVERAMVERSPCAVVTVPVARQASSHQGLV
jgi:nucleotide-binding universal stress UspA family protein